MVKFNDKICNFSWNFKWIGWKLTILEIQPMLTFWPMLTSKIIGGWIQWPEIYYILFKCQVNQMKIEDFRNTTLVVDLGTMLSIWSMLTTKISAWLNPVTWNIYPLQISSQSDENWGFYKSDLRIFDFTCNKQRWKHNFHPP